MVTTSIKTILKRVLSKKQTGVAIILLGITGRLLQVFYFFNIRVDASYQTIATKNLIAGHGITIDSVLPSDLSAIIYEPLIKWPPGFTLLLTPFYFLSGGNYIIAGIVLHSVCAIALIFYTRAILRLFQTPSFLINIYTLVVSFFIYSFYFTISSDAISTSFFVAGMYYILSLTNTEKHSTRKLIVATVFFLICAWTKYLLIPVVFFIPTYLIAKGFFIKDKRIKQSGFALFSALLFGVGALLSYQKYISGASTYVSVTERGFFLQNLADAYPLFPAAFFSPDTLNLLLNRLSIHNIILHVYRLVYLLALVPLTWVSLLFTKTISRTKSLRRSYFSLSILVSLALISVLTVLSVNNAKGQESPGVFWTYIQEPRYYGPLVVLLQLSLFIFFPVNGKRFKGFFYFLLLLMAIETFRGVIFDANRMRLLNREEYSWQYENRFQKYADAILKSAEKKFSSPRTIVTGSSYFMNNRVCLFSQVPILSDAASINQLSSIQTKEPVLLIAIIHKKDFLAFKSFLSTQKEVAGKFDDLYFYTVYVQPH